MIAVVANLGSGADATAATAAGADGAGIVRTEFMFLGRDRAPDVDEQTAEYLAIAETFGDRHVTFRTSMSAETSPLSYLPMPVEENPFLGHRGIQLSLDRGDLLRDQLVALCRVARQAPTSVKFPMVSKVAELQEAREVLSAAAGPQGIPDGLRVGMMVEVPAAALKIGTFLPHLDFISIGTNDLTQYTLAAERGNPAVAGLTDPLDPGVLRLIQQVCNAAHGKIPVVVCGEAAADPAAIPILLGLGVGELSVSGLSVPSVKARVAHWTSPSAQPLPRMLWSWATPPRSDTWSRRPWLTRRSRTSSDHAVMPVRAFVESGPVVRDRGVTVVLVAHLMEETEELCDRVAVVDVGRVVAPPPRSERDALAGAFRSVLHTRRNPD